MDEAQRHDTDDDLLAEFGQVLREQAGQDGFSEDRIEGYRLGREIYRGGQGVVLAAHQQTTKRDVAIKLLLDGALASEGDRARFEREVELAAQLRHPSIVTVHESGRTQHGRQYIAMELVDGARFDAHIRDRYHEGAPPTDTQCREIVRLFLGVCDAIEYAHRRGVIHRDLKPGNVMVTDDPRPVVLDFGIAKATGSERGTTKTGDFLGTLSYAAPEQLGGSPDLIDTRADVYALGVMLYEALTGARPSGGEDVSIAEAIRNVTQQDARRASSINPSVSRDLDAVLRKALERDPGQRYQTAGQLRDELSRAISGRPVRAREHERWYLLKKYVIRHKAPIGVGVALLALTAIAGAFGANSVLKARRASMYAEYAGSLIEPIAATEFETAEGGEIVRDLVGLIDRWSIGVDETLDGFPHEEAPLRSTLGLAYLGQREFADAERELREAFRLWGSVRSVSPDAWANAHHNLGRVLWYQAKYDEAETEYREALRRRTEFYGAEHLFTARTTHHLAATLQDLSKFEESERLWLEVIRVRRKLLEPGALDIANALIGYGSFLREIGRHADAIEQYSEALRIVQASEEAGTWKEARVAHGLGECQIALGQFATARETLIDALRIKIDHGDELDTIRTRLALARLDLAERKELSAALETIGASVNYLRDRMGDSHPDTGAALSLESRVLLSLGRPEDAEASARLAMNAYKSRWGARSWGAGWALATLAQALIDQGREGDAEAPAAESLEILTAVRDPGDPVRRDAEQRAAFLNLPRVAQP